MAISSWLCTSNTKNMHVKIVHPGGHVELHDRPVLAAEIMHRNPKCCVAHPTVFRQPWAAIVAPETTLMLGQKFYVVPISTVRKLQLRLAKFSSPSPDISTPQTSKDAKEDDEDNIFCSCWLSINKNNSPKPPPYTCLKHGDDTEGDKPKRSVSSSNDSGGCLRDNGCFVCLGSKSASSSLALGSSFETMEISRKRAIREFPRKGMIVRGESPKRRPSFDHWQPRLESISEE